MSKWKEYRIYDFADIFNNQRVPLSTLERESLKGDYPYYGASGIIDYVNNFIFEGEFLLVSEDGENLKSRKTPIAFRAKGKFWVNNHAHILKGKKYYSNRLLEYLFKNLDLNPYLTGAVQPKLSKTAIESIVFDLPANEEELETITEVLSSLDDKIDLLHQQNKTLEALAETLFRQWFVKEAELVNEEITLSEIAIRVKQSINPTALPQEIFYHYSLPAFDNGRRPEIQNGVDVLSNKYCIKPGQILISKLNPRTPRVWYIISCKENSICSTEFQVYQSKDQLYNEFIYCMLKSDETRDILAGASSGTSGSHQRVNPSDISNLSIKKPDIQKLEKFHSISAEWLKKVSINIESIQTLETLRDNLLPKLMSGAITVNGQ